MLDKLHMTEKITSENSCSRWSACETPLSLLQVYVAAIEMVVGDVSGFDLSELNRYLWHPGLARIDMQRYFAQSNITMTLGSENPVRLLMSYPYVT